MYNHNGDDHSISISPSAFPFVSSLPIQLGTLSSGRVFIDLLSGLSEGHNYTPGVLTVHLRVRTFFGGCLAGWFVDVTIDRRSGGNENKKIHRTVPDPVALACACPQSRPFTRVSNKHYYDTTVAMTKQPRKFKNIKARYR